MKDEYDIPKAEIAEIERAQVLPLALALREKLVAAKKTGISSSDAYLGYDSLEGGGRRYRLTFPPPTGPHPFDRISDEDRAALRDLAKDKKLIIEVGSFIGGSAEVMLEAMPPDGKIICVDTFQGTKTDVTNAVPRSAMISYILGRLERFENRRTIIATDSITAASFIQDGIADMIFLDANHSYDHVKADIEAWFPKLKPGGVFAGHDFYKWLQSLPWEEIVAKSKLQCCPETEIHWGVVRAVAEKFQRVILDGGRDSSVWHVEYDWYHG